MAKFESTVQFAVNAQTQNVAVLDDFRKRVDGIGKAAQTSTGGIGSLTAGLSGLSRGLGALGIGVSVAGLVGLGKSAVDLAGKLNDASAATTVAATTLDQYRQAGEQVGVSFETITGGLAKLNKSIAEAASGNQEAAKAFQDLGISVTNIDGSVRSTSDIFQELANKIRAAPDDAAIFEQGTKIMGRGFSTLLPLLEEGSQGMTRFQSHFSPEGIKNLDDFGDALTTLGEKLTGLGVAVAEFSLSTMIESFQFLNNTIGETLRNAGILEKKLPQYTSTFGLQPKPSMSTIDGLMSPIPSGGLPKPVSDSTKEAERLAKLEEERLARQRQLASEAERQAREQASALQRLAEEQAREAERQKNAVADFVSGSKAQQEALRFEIDLIGKSRAEQEKLVLLRDIDNDAKRLSADLSSENAAKIMAEAEATKNATVNLLDEFNKKRNDISTGIQEGFQDYMADIEDRATAARDAIGNALRGVEDAFVKLATTGKLSFKDLADSIIADMARIVVRQAIMAPLTGFLGGLFSGGGLGGAGAAAGSSGVMSPSGFVNVSPFAMGGVMTDKGNLPLNRYAMGGIANRPQLALFGEGRGPEAYVPLPDGRSIPVAMQGGGNNSPVVINMTIQSPDAASFKASQGQINAALRNAVIKGARNS